MNKEIRFDDAVPMVVRGVKIATDVLVQTLGPGGGFVSISEPYGTKKTKDGHSAIEGLEIKKGYELDGKDVAPYISEGIKIIQEASSQMDAAVGDNTTTGGLITGSLIQEVAKAISKRNCNPRKLCHGLKWARDTALEHLKKITVQIANDTNAIYNVASVAANGDEEIGKMLAEIHKKIGNAAVTVKLSNSIETTHEIVDGLEIDRGYISPYFITDLNKQICELEKPRVLITDQKISSIQSLLPILQNIASTGGSLLIIAEDVDGDALSTLVVNKYRAGLKVAAIKAPSFGDKRKAILGDIAVLTGGQLLSAELGHSLESININSLGFATSVKISKDKSCIVNSESDKTALHRRCEQIRAEIQSAASTYDKDSAQERYNKLKHGAALISVGGDTESQAKSRKDLVEDASRAARSATESGIVPGAGASYQYLSEKVKHDAQALMNEKSKDWMEGVDAFVNALQCIQTYILYNSVMDTKEAVTIENKLTQLRANDNYKAGYDARNNKFVDDLINAGIVDSAKGPQHCILIATSHAESFALTKAYIVDLPTQEKEGNNQHGGGFGGM